MQQYQPTWDLDSLFPGGSKSVKFRVYLENVKTGIHELEERMADLNVTGKNSEEKLCEFTNALEQTMLRFREASAFISCLSAQDVTDL